MTRPRQGRLVVLLNAGVSLALVGVIAGISVFRSDAHPPGIAEFAPAGTGRVPSDAPATVAASKAPVRAKAEVLAVPAGSKGVPRQIACYGWPDGTTTQTFDPQSPPCISSWDVAAGNGGATSTGVTATAIRVGVPRASVESLKPYAAFFSTHFQLYGRSLQLVPLGRADLSSPSGQQSAAEEAAQQQVFATLVDPQQTSGPAAAPTEFLDTASGKHVISLLAATSQVSSTGLAALAPYAWSYPAGIDETQQAVASMLCQELVGRKATFSPDTSTKNRRLGVLAPDAAHAGGSELDVDAVMTALDSCHSPAVLERVDPTSPSASREALLRLKTAGVTTVLPFVRADRVAATLMPAAEAGGFRPEWVLTATDAAPASATWAKAPAKQVRSLFGLATWSKEVASSLRPAAQAVPGSPVDEDVYHSLLVLASGVQLAGPGLTPSTMAEGLATTQFANPTNPSLAARVGFGDRDHAMVDDVALAWWQPSAQRFCLVGGGTRWGIADLPANDPGLFTPTKGCT